MRNEEWAMQMDIFIIKNLRIREFCHAEGFADAHGTERKFRLSQMSKAKLA